MSLLILVLLCACNKENDAPFSIIPEIGIDRVSHDTIRQFEDVLTITISYKDGDGDLGFEEPTQYAIYIRDLRLNDFDGFYIGPIAPVDSKIAIQGKINVEFPSLFVFGNRTIEKTKFEVKMIDRAGHESNLATSGEVYVSKE